MEKGLVSNEKIKKIAVIGAGAMGAQIAALAGEAGFDVKVRDIEQKYLDRGKQMIVDMYDKRIQRGRFTEQAKKDAMGKLTFLVDIKEAVKDADFIIEAVPEIMDLKKSVLKEITAMSRMTRSLLLTPHPSASRKCPVPQSTRNSLSALTILIRPAV